MSIIGAGLVTVDIIQETTSDWKPLPKASVYSSGGTVCNILCHLAHAGWETHVIGAAGCDPLGVILTSDLGAFGVDCSGVVVTKDTPTRRILHKISTEGKQIGKHKFELSCSRCNRRFPPVSPPPFSTVASLVKTPLDRNTIVVVDRANDLTAALAEQVASAGGITVFEPGYLSDRAPELVERILACVDILKYSRELVWKRLPFHKFLPQMSMPRAKVVIETRGAYGVYVTRGNRRKELVAQALSPIRDGSGAGDAFMAGFLLGLGEDRLHQLDGVTDVEVEAAVARAQARGGLACLFLGSKGLLYSHTSEEIEAAVDIFSNTLRPPEGFGSSRLTGAACVAAPSDGSCAICLLK